MLEGVRERWRGGLEERDGVAGRGRGAKQEAAGGILA